MWRGLFSWNTPFEIRPFALLPTKWFNTKVVVLFKLLDFFTQDLCQDFHRNLGMYIKKHKSYVRIIIEMLTCHFSMLFFGFHLAYFVGHLLGLVCQFDAGGGGVLMQVVVALWWCSDFFGIINGLFCVVMIEWLVRNGASWGLHIALGKTFLGSHDPSEHKLARITWILTWYP